VIPPSVAGSHLITITGSKGSEAIAIFTIVQSLGLSPTFGKAGDVVGLSRSGFRAGRTLSVDFDGGYIATVPATITTDTSGSFTGTVTIPVSSSGSPSECVNRLVFSAFLSVFFGRVPLIVLYSRCQWRN